jgi:hypothetical protein
MAVVGGVAVVGLSDLEEVGLEVDDKPLAGVAVFDVDIREVNDEREDERAFEVEFPALGKIVSPKAAAIKNNTAKNCILGTFTSKVFLKHTTTFDVGNAAKKAYLKCKKTVRRGGGEVPEAPSPSYTYLLYMVSHQGLKMYFRKCVRRSACDREDIVHVPQYQFMLQSVFPVPAFSRVWKISRLGSTR